MRISSCLALLWIASYGIFGLAGCAAYKHYEASRPSATTAMESALTQAGFQRMEADYPDQLQIVRGLPSYSLHSYPTQSGSVYWYYDPGNCGCVLVGDEQAFRKYQWQLIQENDTAAYVADTQYDDVVSLNALNAGMFPPSLFLLGMGPIAGGYFGAPGRGGVDRDGDLDHDRGPDNDHGGGGHRGGGGGHFGGGGFGGREGFGGHGGGGHGR